MPTTGTMKYLQIGDATYEVYDTNEDTKVYQSYKAASGYTYWRPLVIGYSSGSAETFIPADQTNLTYTFETLKVQPSSGTIRFGAAALANGSYTNTISADTLTANRTLTAPDKSGTIAVTSDLHNVPSGGSSGQVLAKASGTDYDLEWATVSSGGGTVTSVGLTNATNGGLTISGSPITSFGSITVGHSNVLTSAQTTQAVYPIKIDKNGHISAYGSAITIPNDIVTGSGSTNRLTIWSDTNTLSSNSSLSISTSYNSSSDLYGKVKLYVGSTGQLDWQGQLVFYSGNLSRTITITPPSLATESRIITLPDKTGTIALTDDIPTVPSNIVNTITTTAGAHTAITSSTGTVSFNVPTTAAHVGAASSSHTHGNITNGGDITATAPTIASGDQLIINDHSASKITNGPTFDGSTTNKYLSPKGTWESLPLTSVNGQTGDVIITVPAKLSDLTNDMDVSDFPNDAGYLTSAHEVPSGGTSGQVLAKNSNTDYDLKWVNQSGGGTLTAVELSQSHYDALSSAQKQLDVLYLINDLAGGGSND